MPNSNIFDASILNAAISNVTRVINAIGNSSNSRVNNQPASFLQFDAGTQQLKVSTYSLRLNAPSSNGWRATTTGNNAILYLTGAGYNGVAFAQPPLIFLNFTGPSSRIILHTDNVTNSSFDVYALKLDSTRWDNSDLRHWINILAIGY